MSIPCFITIHARPWGVLAPTKITTLLLRSRTPSCFVNYHSVSQLGGTPCVRGMRHIAWYEMPPPRQRCWSLLTLHTCTMSVVISSIPLLRPHPHGALTRVVEWRADAWGNILTTRALVREDGRGETTVHMQQWRGRYVTGYIFYFGISHSCSIARYKYGSRGGVLVGWTSTMPPLQDDRHSTGVTDSSCGRWPHVTIHCVAIHGLWRSRMDCTCSQ